MASAGPWVQVIIVNWFGWSDTVACLESLLKNDYPSFGVVVVDNHSLDDSVAQISAWCRQRGIDFVTAQYDHATDFNAFATTPAVSSPTPGQLLLIASDSNLGFTGANNLAMQVALQGGAEYILLLNNDTEVARDFLARLVATAERLEAPGLVGTKINFLTQPDRIWQAGGRMNWFGDPLTLGHGQIDVRGRFAGLQRTDFVSGCAMLISRAVAMKIGGQDDRLFFGLDDVEYSLRARRAGFGLWVNLDIIVLHKGSAAVNSRRPLQWYYQVRNTLMWRRGYYALPQNLLFAFYYGLRWPAQALLRVLRGQWRTSLGMLYGLVDFVRGKHGQCPYPWLEH